MFRRDTLRTSAKASMALALSVWVCSGCGPSQMGPKPEAPVATAGHDDHDHGHGHDHAAGDMHEGHDHGHHTHGQEGPHKGAIVVVAGHKLHLEFVLDAEAGKLTAYVLNDELKEGTTLKQDELVVGFLAKAAEGATELKEPEEVKLAAVNAKDGAAGEFAGQSDKLKGLKEFDGQLMSVTFNDKKYEGVKFEYPKGNEHLAH
jgi:hypothetical protein